MAEGVPDHRDPAGGLAVLRTAIKLRASGHDPLHQDVDVRDGEMEADRGASVGTWRLDAISGYSSDIIQPAPSTASST